MTRGKKERDYRAVNVIRYCNMQISNSTEYAISKAIIDASEKTGAISLKELAEEASVSQTSVSRFVKKIGFPSFANFREGFRHGLTSLHMGRSLQHETEYGNLNAEEIARKVYGNALNNMGHSLKNLDLKKMTQIAESLHTAKSVTIIGNSRSIHSFEGLQLDLVGAGVPAYLFQNEDVQKSHSLSMTDGDVILYINTHEDWMPEYDKAVLKKLKKRNVIAYGFFQEISEDTAKLFSDVIMYGIRDSRNQGYYSSMFLAQILSELFYQTA